MNLARHPPHQPTLIPWIIKNCAYCVNSTLPPKSNYQLAGCPLLSKITYHVFSRADIPPNTLDQLDSNWENKDYETNYKLPEHCKEFKPIL